VSFGGREVGTLAAAPDGLVAFEYADAWASEGFSLSPLSLPLEKRVFVPDLLPHEGVFGVFADSLPDAWGRLLVDRMLAKRGVGPESAEPLTRLAIVGRSGMGALSYAPALDMEPTRPASPRNASSALRLDFDEVARECERLLDKGSLDDPERLDEIFELGGSSGGARPKALVRIDGQDWIVKFMAHGDGRDFGAMEFEYSEVARLCGIEMPPTRLFPSSRTDGYFGVRRFDREPSADGSEPRKIHVASVSALLETSHRIPALSYETLLRLTLRMTGSYAEAMRMHRLMCFNVLTHNRDDHSKNFSFLYDEASGSWRLSPAYDLTCSAGMGGEHATTVAGKGRDIAVADLVSAGVGAGLGKSECEDVALDVAEKTKPLHRWRRR
jgi:serine/threonine-protein kinase HipA